MIQCVAKRMIVQCDRYCIYCCGFIVKCEKRLIKLSVAIFNKSNFISARNLISPLRRFSDKNCYFCWFLSLLRDGESNCSARQPHCWSCFERDAKSVHLGQKTFTGSRLHTFTGLRSNVIVTHPLALQMALERKAMAGL